MIGRGLVLLAVIRAAQTMNISRKTREPTTAMKHHVLAEEIHDAIQEVGGGLRARQGVGWAPPMWG